jgi:hypothetical protein
MKNRINDEQNDLDVYVRKVKLREDLQDIWENDIMPNFALHWDY